MSDEVQIFRKSRLDESFKDAVMHAYVSSSSVAAFFRNLYRKMREPLLPEIGLSYFEIVWSEPVTPESIAVLCTFAREGNINDWLPIAVYASLRQVPFKRHEHWERLTQTLLVHPLSRGILNDLRIANLKPRQELTHSTLEPEVPTAELEPTAEPEPEPEPESESESDSEPAPAGKKDDAMKPRFDLMPPIAEAELVAVLTYGAKKYAPNNWRNLADWRARYEGAAKRHISQWKRGETRDPESGLHHLAHAACSLLFIAELELELENTKPEISG